MRKVIILIVGYLSLGVVISVCQSCLRYDSSITEVLIRGINRSNKSDVDDMTKSIGFEILAGSSEVSYLFAQASIMKNIDFFSKCYATTKCAKWRNDLEIASFSMKFDRDFVYDSDTIKPAVDIFKIESIRSNILIEKDKQDCDWITCTMNFTSELTNRLTFESGKYTVYFSCRTTDGKEFNKERRVIFK